ncbi:MAG: SRPBCC family protein [Ignavibacteriae bacterium]|nr:SRPBCC family protein [Ignavibacteriota bacterium]NOG98845.1 SRPBCC family protein [Ignavibacteriota bacterium]
MKNPIYIKVEKTINHPMAAVWKTVALDFGYVSKYHPDVKSSKFDNEIKQGIGTKRHCNTNDGGYLKEEIIEWNEKQDFKLKLVESSFSMAMIESKFSFQEIGNSTKVTQEFWYRMKSPMGWLSGLMKGKMRKTLENGLIGIEKHLNKTKK